MQLHMLASIKVCRQSRLRYKVLLDNVLELLVDILRIPE